MSEVLSDIFRYVIQMLPMCLTALILFLLAYPCRRRRLDRLGLASGALRETVLCLFILFCAGLAALTLFPANIWTYVITLGRAYPEEITLFSFYPDWEETIASLPYLADVLTPFQEIRRALSSMSYWLMFMMLGNIVMFFPIGFFPALLWRNWRWWKALLLGLFTSAAIEFIQFFIGRSTDIDDVILNAAGALIGFWLSWLLRTAAPKFTARIQCQPKGGTSSGLSI